MTVADDLTFLTQTGGRAAREAASRVEAEIARLHNVVADYEWGLPPEVYKERDAAYQRALATEAEVARLERKLAEGWDEVVAKDKARAIQAEIRLEAAEAEVARFRAMEPFAKLYADSQAEVARLRSERDLADERATDYELQAARLRDGLPQLLRWVEIVTKPRVGEGTYAANDDVFEVDGRLLYNLMHAAEPIRALLAEDGADR